MQTISGVIVGKPDTTPSKPSHQAGVRQGNRRPRSIRASGLEDSGVTGRASVQRSTGINPSDRAPIDPRMPRLTPA